MAKLFGALSLAVFLLSASAHILTFVPGMAVTWAWPLHLAAMAVFAAMIFSGVSIQKKLAKAGRPVKSLPLVPRSVPPWLVVLCAGVFIYSVINFLTFASRMPGSPAEKDGKYYLHNHGKKIRDIDESEYRQFRALEIRGISGHWMAFSIVPMTFFLFVYPAIASQSASDADIELDDQSNTE